MTRLYVITRFLTFPGAMARGIWEHLICRILGLPVEDNRLIRKDELSGHIEHELAATSRGAFSLCFVPAFINGILALILSIGPLMYLFYFEFGGVLSTVLSVIAYWFAFSLYVNSYPLIEDALNMKEKVYKQGTILQKIVYTPGFVFCYIGAFAEKYCITFLLALIGLVLLIHI